MPDNESVKENSIEAELGNANVIYTMRADGTFGTTTPDPMLFELREIHKILFQILKAVQK